MEIEIEQKLLIITSFFVTSVSALHSLLQGMNNYMVINNWQVFLYFNFRIWGLSNAINSAHEDHYWFGRNSYIRITSDDKLKVSGDRYTLTPLIGHNRIGFIVHFNPTPLINEAFPRISFLLCQNFPSSIFYWIVFPILQRKLQD